MDYSNNKVKLPRNCPECGEPLEEFFQNNRKFLGCSGYPNCRFTLDILNYTGNLIIKKKEGKVKYPSECPLCVNKLSIYIGNDSSFFGCNGYPHCRFSLTIDNLENILCPQCGNSMKERTGKYGLFLGCRSYPNCRFTYNIRIFKDKKGDKVQKGKKRPLRKKLLMESVNETEFHDYNRILEVLNEDWQNIKELCRKLDINDKFDIRYLQIRLKHFERKGLIKIMKKDRERYYKIL
ncbi:MAG: topoisomerase DNA-binding C4 zinc finger domain-containing protein [Promethearchaeota archaeon]